MKSTLYSLILFLSVGQLFGQKNLQSQLSHYYQKADTAYKARDYRLAINYLDSSRVYFGSDSLELAYTLNKYALCYDRMNIFDSSLYYYNLAEPVARNIDEKDPLAYLLLLRGYFYNFTKQYVASNRDLEECIELTNIDDTQGAYKLGWCYRLMAHNFLNQKRLDSAYNMIQEMDQYAKLDSSQRLMPQTFNTKGSYYYAIGDLKSALDNLYKKLKFSGYDPSIITIDNSLDIGNIGILHFELGDIERAENYYIEIDKTHRKLDDIKSWNFIVNLKNLTNLYLSNGGHTKALLFVSEYLERYQNLRDDYKDTRYYQGKIWLGRALSGLGKFNEAEMALNEADAFFTKTDDKANLFATYTQLGLMNISQKQFDIGFPFLYNALEIQRSLEALENPNSIIAFKNLAESFIKINSYEKAENYYDSALWVNHRHSSGSIELGKILHTKTEIDLLLEKLRLLKTRYRLNGDIQFLSQSIPLINQLDDVIDYTRKTIRTDNSRLSIAKDYYSLAVYFYSTLYELKKNDEYLSKAITYAERNKAFLLNEISNEVSASSDPYYQELIELRTELKKRLMVQKKQSQFELSYGTYEQIDSIQRKIDEIYNYQHKADISLNTLKSLDVPILSLHVHDTLLYCFFVNKDSAIYKKIPLPDDYQKKIINYRNALSNPDQTPVELSFLNPLYRLIEADRSDRIIIVRDDMFNFLPFELIHPSREPERSLMFETSISYLNSAFDLLSTRKKTAANSQLISFAPTFNSKNFKESVDPVRNELSQLPGAIEEVSLISRIFAGSNFVNQTATESKFKLNASSYRIIHLATHAIVDDTDPNNSRLIFNHESDSLNDGYLRSYEVYGLNLNADLVTLSACNTGFGKIQKGEGVMSLSRAFAYAGVPATVVSLWPASDKSTPELMKYFYQNLKDGQSKDVALNNARKSYLANATGKARHPFYWGGFVLIGDNSPIEDDTNLLVYVIPSVLVIVMILTVYRRKSRSAT